MPFAQYGDSGTGATRCRPLFKQRIDFRFLGVVHVGLRLWHLDPGHGCAKKDHGSQARVTGGTVAINKIVETMEAAVAGIGDGATVLISGFGNAGSPTALCHALLDQGARDLVVVANNAGTGREGLAALMDAGRVRRIVCSYPRSGGSVVFEELYLADKLELELVPQGILSERMRAAAAGLGAIYSPVGVGTQLAEGKEEREIDGKRYVLEKPLKGDLALVEANLADRWGNLTYAKSARNFGPVMAMAADVTVAQARTIVGLGEIDPEIVVTPGIFVDRVVHVPTNAGGA
ncbi:MAG: 3-oxoacid CoA-transferase subunit A [Rhodospirillaceae bacterium]|nr:3-oxoacid CoA-transferase subunit A [Rhodospirillaceae bacterium]